MKKIFIALSLVLLSTKIASAETCADKIASIETELSYAKENNNSNRQKGLEKALKETKENCTDEKLKKAKDAKIADKKADVAKAQKELDQAISDKTSAKKIEKKRKKLLEQQEELQEVIAQ